MRRTCLSLISVFGVGLALAANTFTYRGANDGFELLSTSGRLSQLPGPVYSFVLQGNVSATSAKQGLRITAQRVVGDAVPNGKETKIRTATATGGAHVVKTTNTGGSTLTASKAVYQDRGDNALVTLTGSVTITSIDNRKQRNFNASGPSGSAILDPSDKKDSLRTATLSGGVRVTMNDSAAKGMGQIVATGDRLVYDNVSKPATVTLSGGVNVKGTGNSPFGTFSGARRAVLKLNAKGEVVSTEVES